MRQPRGAAPFDCTQSRPIFATDLLASLQWISGGRQDLGPAAKLWFGASGSWLARIEPPLPGY
jgi:hypothetical protein